MKDWVVFGVWAVLQCCGTNGQQEGEPDNFMAMLDVKVMPHSKHGHDKEDLLMRAPPKTHTIPDTEFDNTFFSQEEVHTKNPFSIDSVYNESDVIPVIGSDYMFGVPDYTTPAFSYEFDPNYEYQPNYGGNTDYPLYPDGSTLDPSIYPEGPGETTESPDGPGETTQGPDGPGKTTESPDGPGETTQGPEGPGETTESPDGPGETTQGPDGPGETTQGPDGPGETTQGPDGPGETTQGPDGPGETTESPDGPGETTESPDGPGETTQGPDGPGETTQGPDGPGEPTEVTDGPDGEKFTIDTGELVVEVTTNNEVVPGPVDPLHKGTTTTEGPRFRPPGKLKNRCSSKSLLTVPKCLKPDPLKEKDMGCGYPVCVVLDKRPMRFKSICALIGHLSIENRLKQMNYIQKGDCYDIISGNADNSTWTTPEVQPDCSKCLEDGNCKREIVLNIDISSVLDGESSGYGGKKFDPRDEKRMAGVPMEFSNVCEAMIFIGKNPNINMKTKLIGLIAGKLNDVIPLKSGTDACVWTEWFNTDDPCTGECDLEHYIHHAVYENIHYGSAMRICPSETIKSYEVQGGNAVKNVGLEGIDSPTFVGAGGRPLKQDIAHGSHYVSCYSVKQGDNQVPAPFLHSPNCAKQTLKNVMVRDRCLDYKIRYCCDSTKMFRPSPITDFDQKFNVSFPVGAIVPVQPILDSDGNLALDIDNNIKFGLLNSVGETKIQHIFFSFPNVEKINDHDLHAPSIEGSIIDSDSSATQFGGEFRSSRLPDGSIRATAQIIINNNTIANIVFKFRVGKKNEKVAFPTSYSIQTYNFNKGKNNVKETRFIGHFNKSGSGIMVETTVYDKTDRKVKRIEYLLKNDYISNSEKIINPANIMSKHTESFKYAENSTETVTFVDKFKELRNQIFFNYLIESPPTAELFSECEWRDWTSFSYPGWKANVEMELREDIAKLDGGKYSKHVCGEDPQNVMYIDAVTREDGIPWYEMKRRNQLVSHYTVSPYFGYACNDCNMPWAHGCKDMKVRYCCAKRRVSSWSNWSNWSSCDKTCGGGEATKTRTCKKIKDQPCAGKVGDERMWSQNKKCNVNSCPVDYTWSEWTPFSECSVSCNAGTKARHRDCTPPRSGGQPCPDKSKLPEMYEETEKCTQTDCEPFEFSYWSTWSQCSTSCGLGQKTSKRYCRSSNTLQSLDQSFCQTFAGELTQKFEKHESCHLIECPVNGGWSEWSEYGECSQKCVYESEKHLGKTKANRKRRKYCNNPLVLGSGLGCNKTESANIKYDSASNAMIETVPCKGLPFCPENCRYTEWSSWSDCSATCIDSGYPDIVKPFNTRQPHLKELYAEFQTRETNMPTKTRWRVEIAPPRHGGTCDIELGGNCHFIHLAVPGNHTIRQIEHVEKCEVWKGHVGPYFQQNHTDYLPAPANLPKNVIPRCPVDCKWEEPEEIFCDELQGEWFQDSKQTCYRSELLDHLKGTLEGFQKNELDGGYGVYAQGKQLYKLLQDFAEDTVKANLDANKMPITITHKCLEVKHGDDYWELNDCDAYGFEHNKFPGLWKQDVNKIRELTTYTTSRRAVLPVLDGLFGGKPCETEDGKFLTKWKPTDGDKIRKIKDFQSYPNDCELPLCDFDLVVPTNKTVAPIVFPQGCVTGYYAKWSLWSRFGMCHGCKQHDVRNRTRFCADHCDKEVEVDEDRCSPSTIAGQPIKGIEYEPCNTCPPSNFPSWAAWSEWSINPATCGKSVKTRKRLCTPRFSLTTCLLTDPSLGLDKEESQVVLVTLPACKHVDESSSEFHACKHLVNHNSSAIEQYLAPLDDLLACIEEQGKK